MKHDYMFCSSAWENERKYITEVNPGLDLRDHGFGSQFFCMVAGEFWGSSNFSKTQCSH